MNDEKYREQKREEETRKIEDEIPEKDIPNLVGSINLINKVKERGERPIINPAQDFKKGVLYLTVPILIPSSEKKGEPLQPVYYMLSSEGKGWLAKNKEDLSEKANILAVNSPPYLNKELWSPQNIERFLRGERVEPEQVFNLVYQPYEKYIEVNDERILEFEAFWNIGTYLYRIFEAYPHNYKIGQKQTGKSKCGALTCRTAFNSISAVNMSPASLFRLVEMTRGTIFIDEAERLSDPRQNQELRELLNIYKKSSGQVYRQEPTGKGKFITRSYDVYSPKIIANIRGLEDVLENRTITINMLRAKTDKGRLDATDQSDDWDKIRHNQYSFALRYASEIYKIYTEDPKVHIKNNRADELWRPILSIARFIFKDGQRFEDFQEFAQQKIAESQELTIDDQTYALLMGLKELVKEDGEYFNRDVRNAMANYLDINPNSDDSEEKERLRKLAFGIGYQLRRFGIVKCGREGKAGIKYKITKAQIDDLCQRYLPQGQ